MQLSATMKETLAKAASQFIAHQCEPQGAYGRTIWPSYGSAPPRCSRWNREDSLPR